MPIELKYKDPKTIQEVNSNIESISDDVPSKRIIMNITDNISSLTATGTDATIINKLRDKIVEILNGLKR